MAGSSSSGPTIQVYGQDRLRDLARELRAQADGKERRKQLVNELREAVRPLMRAAEVGALHIPSMEQNLMRGRPSLRAALARSVSTSVRLSGQKAGVKVFMNPKKMPDGKKSLVKYIEGVPGWERWRHPYFGHDAWFSQESHPFFTRAVAGAEREARIAVNNVIDTMQRDLEH